MSYYYQRRIASLVSTTGLYAIYFWIVIQYYLADRFDAPDGVAFLAQLILGLIVSAVMVQVVVTTVFTMISAAADGEKRPNLVVDERDRLIELKGIKMSEAITGLGFFSSLIVMALGGSFVFALNLILAGFGFGSILSNLMMLGIYRKDA